MSGDERDPKNPVDESGEGKFDDEKENGKIVGPSNKEKKWWNERNGEDSDAEISDDEMSYEKWKAWRKKKKEQCKKKKSSSRDFIDSSDDSDTNTKKRASRSSN